MAYDYPVASGPTISRLKTAAIAAVSGIGALAATAVIGQPQLPEAPGRAEVLATCTQCHGIDLVTAQRRSPDEWSQVVSRMIGNGASMTDEQYKTIVAYLSQNMADHPPEGHAPDSH